MRKLLIFAFAFGLQAQRGATTIYLPGGTPYYTTIVSPGCTNATPTVCTVTDASGLAVEDVVGIWGVAAAATNHMSSVRGVLKIKAISGNLITLKTLAGADLAANGAWEDGNNNAGGQAAGPQYLRKLTAFTPVSGPRGRFDGWTGPVTRRWATGTHNGLADPNGIVVTGGTLATVTYTYNHGLTTGNKVRVFNTTSSQISGTSGTTAANGGKEYSITVTGATTYTFTLGGSVTNADYTHNDACGPGVSPNGTVQGTDNCVRISAGATTTNWAWTSNMSRVGDPATAKFLGEGINMTDTGARYAEYFMLDLKAQPFLDYALKVLNQMEVMGGNNFPANEAIADGGNYSLAAQVSNQMVEVGTVWTITSGYLTSAQKQTALDKALNDIADPSPCTKILPARIAVTTGTATAADATHITLAAGASAVNDFYLNNIVEGLHSGDPSDGLITAYNGTTKVATVSAWDGGTPSNTTAYSVFESYSSSASTHSASVTLTGYNTTWNTVGAGRLQVGDYIFSALNRWPGFLDPYAYGGVVTAVTSDTQVTVFSSSSGISTTPGAGWITHPWATGDCGLQWLQNFWTGTFGSQPSQYLPRGGNSANASNIAGDLASYMLHFYLAVIDDDPRAVANLARFAVSGVDINLALDMGYMTGIGYSGESYSPGRLQEGMYGIAWALSKSVTSYNDLDVTGNWVKGFQAWKQYGLYPTHYGYPRYGPTFGLWPSTFQYVMDYGTAYDSSTTESKYTQYLINTIVQGNNNSFVNSTYLSDIAIRLDPNAPTSDYRVQPTQYVFSANSRAVPLTFGWPNPATWRGDAFISRTGWSSTSDTHVWYGSKTLGPSDHETVPQAGDLQVWKAGNYLLGNDNTPTTDFNESVAGPYLEFGGATSYRGGIGSGNGPAVAVITRWAGTQPYGDANSNYVYALSDLAGAYTTTLTRAVRHVIHFKKAGREEIIVTFADVASATPIIIRDQVFYPMNSEAAYTGPNGITNAAEGATSYPGSGGCASLDTNRVVLTQQDGSSGGGPTPLPGTSQPTRQYNLITKFLSPGTITLNCDGSAVGVPSGASGYTGSTGHAERVSIYGGSSVGGTSTTLEHIAIHKIATQPDTSLTAALLSAGSSWAAVQTTDTVSLFARGGTLNNSASFTSTHSGTAMYVITGLTPSTYTVKLGGVPVSGSPFIVPTGNNSLEFESTAGVMSVDIGGAFNVGLVPSSKGATSAKIPQ